MTLKHLIGIVDDGYARHPEEGRFVARDDGPARGKLPLTIQGVPRGP